MKKEIDTKFLMISSCEILPWWESIPILSLPNHFMDWFYFSALPKLLLLRKLVLLLFKFLLAASG